MLPVLYESRDKWFRKTSERPNSRRQIHLVELAIRFDHLDLILLAQILARKQSKRKSSKFKNTNQIEALFWRKLDRSHSFTVGAVGCARKLAFCLGFVS
jgi:hypothetical protein